MRGDATKGSGLRERTQAHSKWLTVLGAAIVFGMFVVKDAYRESLREIVYSIQTAETSFQIVSGFARVDARLRVIEEQTFVDQTPKELLRLGKMLRRRMNIPDEQASSISDLNFLEVMSVGKPDAIVFIGSLSDALSPGAPPSDRGNRTSIPIVLLIETARDRDLPFTGFASFGVHALDGYLNCKMQRGSSRHMPS